MHLSPYYFKHKRNLVNLFILLNFSLSKNMKALKIILVLIFTQVSFWYLGGLSEVEGV